MKKTIHADFINNNIFIKYLNGKTFKKSFKNLNRNISYIKMHEAKLLIKVSKFMFLFTGIKIYKKMRVICTICARGGSKS